MYARRNGIILNEHIGQIEIVDLKNIVSMYM